ncbi:MAG: hypothetical protein WCR42_08900 [bacterium]
MINSFLFSMFLSLKLLSMNDCLEYQYYIEIPNTDISQVLVYKSGKYLYTINQNIELEDNLNFKFNVFSKDTNFVIFANVNENNNDPKAKGSFRVHDFALNEKYLVILTQFNIFIFEKDDNNIYIYQNKISLENYQQFQKIILKNELLVLLNNSTYSYLDTQKNNIYMGKVNLLEKPYNLKIDYIYNVEYLELSMFQPKELVSYDLENDLCFISETLNYKIRIFNNGILQDSIVNNISAWNDSLSLVMKQKIDNIPNDRQKYNNIITSVSKDYYASSKIREIKFLEPDKLLVIWEGPEINGTLNLHFDLWKNISGKWMLIKEDIQTPDNKVDDLVLNNSYLQCGYFKVLDDGYLVGIEYKALNMFDEKYKNMKLGDFWKLCEKAIDESELGVALYIYKFDLEKKDE